MNLTKSALRSVGAIASVAGAIATGLPAIAQVAATKNIDGNIVVSGLQNYGSYQVEYSGAPKLRRSSANACGVISLRHSTSYPITTTSSFTREGTNYSMADLPVGATPRCVNGALAEPVAAAAFKDSNNVVFFTGLTPYSSHQVAFNDIPTNRRSRANACGMISLRNSPNYPLSSSPISVKMIMDDSSVGASLSDFTPSNLNAGDIPICRQGKAYFPEGWGGNSSGGGS